MFLLKIICVIIADQQSACVFSWCRNHYEISKRDDGDVFPHHLFHDIQNMWNMLEEHRNIIQW